VIGAEAIEIGVLRVLTGAVRAAGREIDTVHAALRSGKLTRADKAEMRLALASAESELVRARSLVGA